MPQTKIERLLSDFLLTSNASKGTRILTLLQLRAESKMLEMCQYLADNPKATDEEIRKMATLLA